MRLPGGVVTLPSGRPTPFEDRIVRMLLAGSLPPFAALRQQWDVAGVVERSTDDWGMTTLRIWVPIDAVLALPCRQDFGDVIVRAEGTQEWRGCILEVERGVLHTLLLPSIPDSDRSVEVSYLMLVPSPDDPDDLEAVPVPDRDWAELREYFERKGAATE